MLRPTVRHNLFVFEERLAVVDLPGYGYAKASKTVRSELIRLIGSYLAERDVLSVLILILDARREDVSELDKRVMGYLNESGLPVVAFETERVVEPGFLQKTGIKWVSRAGAVQSKIVAQKVKSHFGGGGGR